MHEIATMFILEREEVRIGVVTAEVCTGDGRRRMAGGVW
jgi:hypothetical protein